MKHLTHFEELYTERLILRELIGTDAADILEIFGSSEVLKFYNFTPIFTLEQAEDIIQFFLNRWNKREGIRWAIQLNDKVIGTIGIHNIQGNCAEIGYELNDRYFKQGYMTEALEIVLHYVFYTLDIDCILGKVDERNRESKRSLEKFGFLSNAKIIELKGDGFHLFLETYHLPKSRYFESTRKL